MTYHIKGNASNTIQQGFFQQEHRFPSKRLVYAVEFKQSRATRNTTQGDDCGREFVFHLIKGRRGEFLLGELKFTHILLCVFLCVLSHMMEGLGTAKA